MERKSLRTILFILFFLLILLLGAYFFINMRQEKISSKNDSVMVQSPETARQIPKAPEPSEQEKTEAPEELIQEPSAAEAEEKQMVPAASSLPQRYVVTTHKVEEGESFSLVTGYYWEDIFLWPDLYVRNDMRTDDPDLIYPEEIIDIYNRLGKGDQYTPAETDELMKSYLQVYRIYKALGPEKNNSVWSLLWCAAKYDHDFLDKYADQIDPEDLAMARKYISEEGFLE